MSASRTIISSDIGGSSITLLVNDDETLWTLEGPDGDEETFNARSEAEQTYFDRVKAYFEASY